MRRIKQDLGQGHFESSGEEQASHHSVIHLFILSVCFLHRTFLPRSRVIRMLVYAPRGREVKRTGSRGLTSASIERRDISHNGSELSTELDIPLDEGPNQYLTL